MNEVVTDGFLCFKAKSIIMRFEYIYKVKLFVFEMNPINENAPNYLFFLLPLKPHIHFQSEFRFEDWISQS